MRRLFSKLTRRNTLHSDLVAYGLNNKKHFLNLVAEDQSLQETLDSIKQMPTKLLFDGVQKALLETETSLPSFKRQFKEFSQLLLKNADSLDLDHCTSVFYLMFRLSLTIDESTQIKMSTGVKSKEIGGHSQLVTALNKRLMQVLREAIPDETSALTVIEEILKTPCESVKADVIRLVVEFTNEGRLTSSFHFKFLSIWQKELKVNRTNELNQHEKRHHKATVELINTICPQLVSYIESLQTQRERARLVPILTKFCGQEQAVLMARLQDALTDSLREATVKRDQLVDLTTLMYYYEEAGLPQTEIINHLFNKICDSYDISDFTNYELHKFTKVFLSQRAVSEQLITQHIHRQKDIEFNPQVTKQLLQIQGPLKAAYQECLKQVKLCNQETGFTQLQILDRIELTNILIETFKDDIPFLNQIFHRCFLHNMSLTFFRLSNLIEILTRLSIQKPSDRDFWLRCEDYIMRNKKNYSVQEVTKIVTVFSVVNASQLFWSEIEQVLLARSSDFRQPECACLLVPLCLAMQHRSNETFWKVFSNLIVLHFETYTQQEVVSVLEIIGNEQLFQMFYAKFISPQGIKIQQNINEIVSFMLMLSKHQALDLDPQFADAMMNFIKTHLQDKQFYSKNRLDDNARLVLKVTKLKPLHSVLGGVIQKLIQSYKENSVEGPLLERLRIIKFEQFTNKHSPVQRRDRPPHFLKR